MEYPADIRVPNGEENQTIRDAVLDTARYIKESGSHIEEQLRGDSRYSFINSDDEYYDFYQYTLRNCESTAQASKDHNTSEQFSGLKNARSKEPQEPYPFSFMSFDKNVTKKDLEIIKLAAAFCVVNEKSNYLEKMRLRFENNSQFGFLNANHALNTVFSQFLNQYKQARTNIVGPPMFNFRKDEDFKYIILRRSFQRAEYEEYKKEMRTKQDKTLNLLKIQFAAFDWTKFKVADKIQLPKESETVFNLPQPLDFGQLTLKRIDQSEESDLFKDEGPSQADHGSKGRKRNIRAAGETRLKRRNKAMSNREGLGVHAVECPITHKMIPEGKFDKHLQTLLSDPHYSIEREKYEAKHKLTNLTTSEVFENIKKIARKSGDQT